jgi:hypothetical protein
MAEQNITLCYGVQSEIDTHKGIWGQEAAHRFTQHLLATSGFVARNHRAVHVLVIAEEHVGMAGFVIECSRLVSWCGAAAKRGLWVIEPEAFMPHVELSEPPIIWSYGGEHISMHIEAIVCPASCAQSFNLSTR